MQVRNSKLELRNQGRWLFRERLVMCIREVLFCAHLYTEPTGSLAMDWPLSLTTTLGNQGERFMIPPSTRDNIKCRQSSVLLFIHLCVAI